MRRGIVANLAVILAVSGMLLFAVFGASLERSAIDAKIQEAVSFEQLVHAQMLTSESSDRMWEGVRSVCKTRAGPRLLLYDQRGNILGGCPGKRELSDKPSPFEVGRRLRVLGTEWPTALFRGMVVVMDVTDAFPHGVRSARIFFEVPPSVFAPAWKFFGAYLILTQVALFVLGYLLFHRTVIGPVRDVAKLAGKALGMTESDGLSTALAEKGDIQRISASLRSMIVRIVEEREKREALIEQLRKINQDLEAAQQGLIRSEKLASVGRLAAGIAHEVGNPLQILIGYVALLKRDQDDGSRREILDRMAQELERIHDILQRLLDFARPIREAVVACDLNALLRDCAELVRGRKGFRHATVEFALDPNLPIIETEPEKVRQIIVNLLFNSADAIPETGGTISLRTRSVDHAVEIAVEDTGAGISEADLEKVLDPFFTTKEPGKGTGLGLAVCLGLLESLGGSIRISSQERLGTVATVTLPKTRESNQGR